MAKNDKETAYIQVTKTKTSGNIAHRRRKLEAIPWLPSDRVLIFEFRSLPDPVRRRDKYYFRIHELKDGVWSVKDEAIEVLRKWFKVKCGDRT